MKKNATSTDIHAEDSRRLDFLEQAGAALSPGMKWVCRPSTTGRGYRLHQDPHPEVGQYDTVREAIDAARGK